MTEKIGFLQELKRRNVFRVGIAYAIASWLIIQVLEIVLDSFGSPEWVMKTVLVILACGLPMALIFAWAFELTPEGIKREKDVDRSRSITPQTGRKLDFVIIGVLAAAVVLLVVDRFTLSSEVIQENAGIRHAEGEDDGVGSNSKSIAVLPFVNMSSDPEQEYFSDGISEEILNALAQVKDLKVAGRTSSFAFKGENQDLRKVGEALGVANILEGSVRKSGNKVRITAQLIQVEDGFHLWSESYDRELTDVFEIQDEISSAILQQLKAHLLAGEQELIVAQRADSEAYDKFLLAKQRIYERSRPALESATGLLDEVIATDPDYAPAYAQRAIAGMLLSDRNYGSVPQAEALAEARVYIDQALRLDPEQPEALSALGLYHMNRPGETDAAISALEKALQRNPNLVNASNWLQSSYALVGRRPEAIAILEDLRERDPLYRPGIANLNTYYVFQDRLDEAQEHIQEIKPFMPNDPFLLRLEAHVLYAQGRLAEGLQLAERALAIQPENFANIELRGMGLASTGQIERVAEEGSIWQRPFALMDLGRKEEALMEARKLAASGENVSVLIGLLANYGMADQMVQYFDENWGSLDAYEEQFPTVGVDSVSGMLDLAYGFSVAGDQQRFEDAMQRARAGLERIEKLGFTNGGLDMLNAVYFTMAGDRDEAIRLLGSALDRHWLSGSRISDGWAALKALEGDPQYQAIEARMFVRVNEERAKLGLPPLAT
jgi:TolB-like protein/Flp pilus assembly protein TadD